MKKVLLITNYAGMWPFAKDICELFNRNNIRCNVIDYGKHEFIDAENKKHIKYFYEFKLLKIIKALRYFQNKILVPYFFKRLLSKIGQYNSVIVLYHSPFINQFSNILKSKSKRIILYYAGSDFYRASNVIREKNRTLINACDIIAFTNNAMAKDFTEYYQDYRNKYVVFLFGSRIVDMIKYAIENNYQKTRDKILITIGYSGSRKQQHIRILNSIHNIIDRYYNQIKLVFPMTYNTELTYVKEIKEIISTMNIDSIFIDNKVSEEEIVDIRLNSDIVINMQTTDQASASLIEYIASGNIMLVGDWLPYSFWEEAGICYHKINFENMEETLNSVLSNFNDEHEKASGNISSAIESFSWNSRSLDLLKLIDRD